MQKYKKVSYAYKGYASTYHLRILKYFNPELQLNNAESASKNILIDLLSQLRGFKFVIALALEFQKIKGDDETKYSAFYSNSKAKTVINEMILTKYLNQSLLRLYQTYQKG